MDQVDALKGRYQLTEYNSNFIIADTSPIDQGNYTCTFDPELGLTVNFEVIGKCFDIDCK